MQHLRLLLALDQERHLPALIDHRPKSLRRMDLEVRHRDLIGHGLVGPFALELSNIDGETCLAIPTHPTAEVTNQPLQFQFGQLVPGAEVEPNGY